MTSEDFDIMTVAEAAKELGLSERAVQDRLQRGVMRGRRIGERVWVVSRAEVDKWKERGKIRPGRPRRESTQGHDRDDPSIPSSDR